MTYINFDILKEGEIIKKIKNQFCFSGLWNINTKNYDKVSFYLPTNKKNSFYLSEQIKDINVIKKWIEFINQVFNLDESHQLFVKKTDDKTSLCSIEIKNQKGNTKYVLTMCTLARMLIEQTNPEMITYILDYIKTDEAKKFTAYENFIIAYNYKKHVLGWIDRNSNHGLEIGSGNILMFPKMHEDYYYGIAKYDTKNVFDIFSHSTMMLYTKEAPKLKELLIKILSENKEKYLEYAKNANKIICSGRKDICELYKLASDITTNV